MIQYIFNIFFLLIFHFSSVAQILQLNQPLFSDEPFFNTNFIKKNNIKSITGAISSKKVKDIIRTKGLDYYYEFNQNGKLKIQLISHSSNKIKDTTTVVYEYNADGTIKIKRTNDSYGFFSYNYIYNKNKNITSQTYCREENKLNSKKNFELKNQFIISTDSFSYQKLSKKQFKKLYYNSYKKVYKETFFYNDEFGYLIEKYTRFVIGNKKEKITYEYDEKGRLSKKNTFINIAEDKIETEVYTYDDIGNLLTLKIYLNEHHKTTKQFLYDKKTMLLTAQIIQDIASNYLRIIKYSYTFFGDDKYVENLPLESVKK